MLAKEFNPQIYVTIYDIFMKKLFSGSLAAIPIGTL